MELRAKVHTRMSTISKPAFKAEKQLRRSSVILMWIGWVEKKDVEEDFGMGKK